MGQIISYDEFLRERKKYDLILILSPKVTEDTIIGGNNVNKVLEEISGGPYVLRLQRVASWRSHVKISNVLDYLVFLDDVEEICRTLCPA